MVNGERKSDERALDALMAAAFRISGSDEPMSEKEAQRLAANPPRLSPEDEAAIASLGTDFVDRLSQRVETEKHNVEEDRGTLDQEIEEAYAAMNRGKGADELSEQTRREIEKKRRELLGEEESEDEE